MSVKERIELCMLIEKMEEQKECSKRLGLVNNSTFLGKKVGEQKSEQIK